MMNKYKSKKNLLKKISGMTMIFVLLLTMFSGCQLADKDAVIKQSEDEEITNGDIFCGVFISTKDIFFDDDIDLSAKDIKRALSGEEIEYNPSKNESSKIYAKKVEKVDENGATYGDYSFEGYEGVQIFRYYVMEKDGEISYASESMDEAVDDAEIAIKKTDNGSEDGIKATLNVNKEYVTKNSDSIGSFVLYVYEVYQERNGEIYMVPGECSYGLSTGEMKISLAKKSNIMADGEEQEYNFGIEVTVNQVTQVDKTILRQMNSENQLIDSIEIDNSNISDTLKISKKAEYIIVEKYVNGKISSRDMIETKISGDEDLSVELPVKDENEVFIKQATVFLKKK